jgi:ribulose-phosphate 3-epimerase
MLGEIAGDALDMALCMSVNPGWGGQSFIENSFDKLHRLRRLLGDEVGVEVDGGVNDENAGAIARAGANVLVAGSAVFASADPAATYAAIAEAAGAD